MKIDAGKSSPHQSARPAGVTPRVIVLHADAAASHVGTIAWILNPDSKVSYHYVISRDGGITQLVPVDRKAWHAGVSSFAGVKGCNDYSVGVSFSNKNDGIEPYDPRAIATGVEIIAALCTQYGIGLDSITTHEQIARPMGRKTDPGIQFPHSAFITAVRRKLGG